MHCKEYDHRRGGKIQNRHCQISLLALLLALSIISIAFAQGDAGRESPFILGAGARGMGMGRAFVSLSGEASSAFSNAAATYIIDRSEFSALHTSLFLGTNYDCLALAHPAGSIGVFTLSLGRLGTSSFTGRDEYNRPDQSISSSESLMGLSFARKLRYGFSGGITLKGVGQEIGDNAGYGFGLDLGFQYKSDYIKGLVLGLSSNDLIQPSIKLLEVKDKYQTVARFGLAYTRAFRQNYAATGVFEIEKISGRNSKLHPGLEMAFYDKYFIRGGADDSRATFGAGIIYNFLKLDYAYENIEYFGATHRISLGFSFGKSVKKSQQIEIDNALISERTNWEKTADQQRQSEFSGFISKADSLQAAGRYQDAIAYYQRALAIDENSSHARVMSDSAMNLIITGAASSAGDKKREEMISRRTEAALEHFKAGEYNDAITEYELILDIDPGNQTVTGLLQSARQNRVDQIDNMRKDAQALKAKGDNFGALLAWDKIIVLEPGDPDATRNIESIRSLLKADALISSAVAAINSGKYSDAVTYLEQAQIIKPNDASIKTMLADAKAKSAPATTLTDIKASSERWAIYLKGLESYQSGDYQTALTNWESLKKFYPNNADLDKNIAQAQQRLSTEGGKP
jgi:tetratricopeptide (TPR) repeat protein